MSVSAHVAALREGDHIRLSSGEYRVAFVNECRAHIVPVKHTRTEQAGGDVTSRELDISPNSELQILSREV